MKRFLALLVLAASFYLTSAPAEAHLKFCNRSSETISVAVAWFENGHWNASGWYNADSKACVNAVLGDLPAPEYYFFAEGRTLKWEGTYPFCTSNEKFSFLDANRSDCDARQFRKVGTNGVVDFVNFLGEDQPTPIEAARQCDWASAQGTDAFSKCWVLAMANAKQRSILGCYDRTESNAALAICANKNSLAEADYRVINCADEYARKKDRTEFFVCLGVVPKFRPKFKCAFDHLDGPLAEIICSPSGWGGGPTAEESRILNCVARNPNDYVEAGLCAAGDNLSPEQRRLLSCVLKNTDSYAKAAICAVGNNLSAEQQTFADCAVSTGGQPYAFAVCYGGTLTKIEIQKCIDRGIGGDGCFGDNNAAVKLINNWWHDTLNGPGEANDLSRFRDQFISPDDNGFIAKYIRDPLNPFKWF